MHSIDPSKDKRRFPRIEFGFCIEEAGGSALWMTANISQGGCFLKTREHKPINTLLSLSFKLPGSRQNLHVLGEVKHVADHGMGVKFMEMDTVSEVEIHRFMRDYCHAVASLW